MAVAEKRFLFQQAQFNYPKDTDRNQEKWIVKPVYFLKSKDLPMFESIKHWLESLEKDSALFDHAEDESIHLALASVLYHVIQADHKESDRELKEFKKVLKQEFSLSREQIDYLHTTVESASSEFEKDLQTINTYLKDKPMVKMSFMKKLIKLISVDGVMDDELDDFYQALHVIFPEIKTR